MVFVYLEISCGVPPAGDNTNVPSDSLLYQDSYEYTCLDGYETNDTVTTNCLADRSLSLANPPNCTSEWLNFYSFSFFKAPSLV